MTEDWYLHQELGGRALHSLSSSSYSIYLLRFILLCTCPTFTVSNFIQRFRSSQRFTRSLFLTLFRLLDCSHIEAVYLFGTEYLKCLRDVFVFTRVVVLIAALNMLRFRRLILIQIFWLTDVIGRLACVLFQCLATAFHRFYINRFLHWLNHVIYFNLLYKC